MSKSNVTVSFVNGVDGFIDSAAFTIAAAAACAAKREEQELAALANDEANEKAVSELKDAVDGVWSQHAELSKSTATQLAQMALMSLGTVPNGAAVKEAAERIARFTAAQPDTYLTVSGKGRSAGIYLRSRVSEEQVAKLTATAAASE